MANDYAEPIAAILGALGGLSAIIARIGRAEAKIDQVQTHVEKLDTKLTAHLRNVESAHAKRSV